MSDTHLPRRAKALPEELLERLPHADVVVHAGDWVDLATLDLLQERSRRLIGVYGNNDGVELRARLPEVARAELAGVRPGVVPAGARRGRRAAVRRAVPRPWVLVFGHGHVPWDPRPRGRSRLLAPAARRPAAAALTVRVGRLLSGRDGCCRGADSGYGPAAHAESAPRPTGCPD
ncbi:Phosphoesterase OS=Streptomyces antimycoticus OX=68175 GN=SANT12839_087850 PE=3 SV=1 [Streptomyces antimycoticus]